MHSSRERDREWLERELETDGCQKLLGKLSHTNPFLRQFKTWADVVAFMRKGNSADPRKDEILSPILATHKDDGDSRWRAIMLVIFWPGLESIYFQKRYWDEDTDQLWSTLQWCFLEVLCRIDVKRRPVRLVQKVYNDTVHRLYEECRRIWDRKDREKYFDQEELHALADEELTSAFAGKVHDCENFVNLGLRQEIAEEVRHLREHVEAGRISETDFLLLVGTKVYRQSIADYARETGLCYATIRKRHQRAMAALRRVAGKKR